MYPDIQYWICVDKMTKLNNNGFHTKENQGVFDFAKPHIMKEHTSLANRVQQWLLPDILVDKWWFILLVMGSI